MKIETNKVIGKTFTVPQLMGEKGYDAVFLGVGAGAPAFLGIPGRVRRAGLLGQRVPHPRQPDGRRQVPLPGHAGLHRQERGGHRRRQHRDGLPARRQAAGHRRRCAASTAAPRPRPRPASRSCATPRRRAIEFFFLHAPVEILTDADGNVTGMKVEEMVLGEPDEKGRRKPVAHRHASRTSTATPSSTRSAPRPTPSSPSRRRAWRSTSGATSSPTTARRRPPTLPGVFAGGDIVTGGATVILAMGAGRRAARAIAA